MAEDDLFGAFEEDDVVPLGLLGDEGDEVSMDDESEEKAADSASRAAAVR